MRRSILLAGTTALAITLAACGGGGTEDPTSAAETSAAEETSAEEAETTSEETAAEPAEGALVVWTDETRIDGVTAAADQFTADSGVPVEIVLKNFDDIRPDFAAQVPTGEGPDITVGAHDWVGELTTNGLVAPIELGDAVDTFNETAIQAFTVGGQIYAVPYAVENIGLIRNVDLAPEPAPATFDEMIAAGEAAGVEFPFMVQMGENGDGYTMYPFQTSFGAPVFNQDADGNYTAELGMGGEGGQAFAQWLSDQGAAGVLDTAVEYDIVVEKFAAGEAPYIVGGPWMIGSFEGMNLAVDPFPAPGPNPAVPFMGVQGFYLSAQSENPLQATDFLVNYLGAEDIQYQMYEAGFRLPANNAAAERAMEDPIQAGFAAVAEGAVPMPSIPEMGSVWAFWGVTEAQIVGGADAVATWDKMVADIEGAING